MFTVLVVVAIISYFIYSYIVNKEYREHLSKIKSERGVPFLGHVFNLGRTNDDLLPALERMWQKFGRDKFRIKVGPIDQIIISKPEDIEVILSSNHLLHKNVFYRVFDSLLGTGLLTTGGEHWRAHRKLLTPIFHFNILETYLQIFQKDTKILLQELEEKINVDFDCFPIFNQRWLTTLTKLGIGGMDESINFEEYAEYLQNISVSINNKIFSSWKSIDFLYNLTSEGKLFNKSIDEILKVNSKMLEIRKGELKEVIEKVNSGEITIDTFVSDEDMIKKRNPLTFMELLLLGRTPDGKPLSDKDIMYEMNTFSLAGHQTLTSSASFALYNLSDKPEIQEKILDEQIQITGGNLDKPITYSDLQEMRYLDRVIKESMRLSGPIVMFGRKITTKTVLPDGIVLPIGSQVLMLPLYTHLNPDVFPDPYKFDPDRFLDRIPSPYMYYPFSAGPRNCIGQKLAILQLKFWLSTIIRSLELLPCSYHTPKLIMEVTVKSSTGAVIQVRKRRPRPV